MDHQEEVTLMNLKWALCKIKNIINIYYTYIYKYVEVNICIYQKNLGQLTPPHAFFKNPDPNIKIVYKTNLV